MRGVILGGVEGGFGDADGGSETSDRDRCPLVRGQFRLLAGRNLRQQPIAQAEILRLEIAGLGRGHRGGNRRRQLHPRRRQFQRAPGGVDAASVFRIGESRLRRDLAGVEPDRDDQRRFAGGVTQQPCDLLDCEQLVDRCVLVIDSGGNRPGKLVERFEHRGRRVHVLLGQARGARSLRLAHGFPEFLLQRGRRLEQAVELGHQRLLLGEFHSPELARARWPSPAFRYRECCADISRCRLPSARRNSTAGWSWSGRCADCASP